MSSMYEGFDDVEASYGFVPEPLPKGWYPMVVEKVLDTKTSVKGSLSARLQLQVTEGEYKDKRAFVSLTMTPAKLDQNNQNKTEAELKKNTTVIQQLMSGWMKSINATTSIPAGADEDEKVCSFFNIGTWDGSQFMANIKYRAASGNFDASNNLGSFRNLDDEKYGIAVWREKSVSKDEKVAQTI